MRGSIAMNDDVRGSFGELWRRSQTKTLGIADFAQSNLSRSAAGVLRGLHFHQRQTDLWIVPDGQAHVCVVDVRERLAGGSAPPVTTSEVYSPGDAIMIPEGVAHEFWALTPVSLLYFVTKEYDGSDEFGFAWDDPEVAAAWPSDDPILSDRDSGAPSLRDAITAAQSSGQISSR